MSKEQPDLRDLTAVFLHKDDIALTGQPTFWTTEKVEKYHMQRQAAAAASEPVDQAQREAAAAAARRAHSAALQALASKP